MNHILCYFILVNDVIRFTRLIDKTINSEEKKREYCYLIDDDA